MMKVLLVSSGSGSRGGGEIYLHHLAAGLSRFGHCVHALCSNAPPMNELVENLRRYGKVSRAELPNTYRRPTRCLGAALDFTQHRRISRIFQKLSPDVVHINQQVAEDGLDLLLAARSSGIPFLSTIHIVHSANLLNARLGRLRDLVTRAVFRRVNTIHITVAERARHDLIARFGFLDPHQVKVVLNGVFFSTANGARARTRKRWGVAPEEIVIGSVGRLEAQKAPDVALEIIAGLVSKGLRVRYIWIGDGPMRTAFQQQARGLGIASYVKLEGWRDDVISCLQGLDIFLMPSRFEGMSLALLEAMGAGLCCCVSDVDGMGEAIQHGLSGYLCAPGEVSRWCEQIGAVVANPALRVAVGRRARDFALGHFSINSMASSTIQVYQDVMRWHQEPRKGKIV
jgi:glycosyltransferase involved in cell wall biosynthesis